MNDEPRWRRYLRLRGPDLDADINDELRFHLEMRERDHLAEGKSPEEARAAARASFGDVDEVRDWLRRYDRKRQRRKERRRVSEGLIQDIRYALRQLRQQPGFTLAVVVVLALGMAVTTASFSLVDAVLLRPLPFPQDDRLVRISNVEIPIRLPEPYPKTMPDLAEVAAMRSVFAGVAAFAPGGVNLTGAGEPLRVRIAMVTPSFFATMGVMPALGRPFTPDEGEPGAAGAAIISEDLWRSHFGANRAALGQSIALNGKDYRVVGVMPRGFGFPEDSQVWMPLPVPMSFTDWEPFRQYMPSQIVGRLAPGVTIERAREQLGAVSALYSSPEVLADISDDLVQPLRETLVGDRRGALLVLLGATALVLLIACANVANLLLSRASVRRRELILRSALGATPWRLMQQLLVESVLVALLGGALGVLLAGAGLTGLEVLVPAGLAGAAPLEIDGRVLLFALAMVGALGISFGLWPALGARMSHAGNALRTGDGASAGGRESSRLRRLFVVAQLSLALTLLVAAGVMLRSFQSLLATDPGIRPESVASAELALARASYGSPAERREFVRGVLERLQAIPGVAAAAVVNELPMRGGGRVHLAVEAEGQPRIRAEDQIHAQDLRITPDYFRTLGIPLLSGRSLATPADSLGPAEVVINQELARMLWPGEEAVGKRVRMPGGGDSYEVVGVAGDVLPTSLDSDVTPQIYFPLLPTPYPNLAIVVRGQGNVRTLSAWMREAVHAAAPEQALYNVRSMEEVISASIAPRRTNTMLIALFGGLAVALAGVGVYAVIAYGVARRTREIGIRIALGARPGRVVGEVLREGLWLATVGIVLGLMGAWMLTRTLAGLVYGVSPRDPLAFVLAPLVLLGIALLASLLPARRAASVDPAAVLKVQ